MSIEPLKAKSTTIIALALVAWALTTSAQEADSPSLPLGEVGITVALPAAEAPGAQLVAGGQALPFRVVERTPWEVAIFFDQLLSDPKVSRNATVRLSEKASALADLGPVQILLGGESVRSALPPSSDSGAISDALGWLRIRESSADFQAELRREFAAAAADGERTDNEVAALLERVLAQESELIRVQREGLLLWATERRTLGPRLLLLVGSGYDVEPAVFYRQLLRDRGRSGVEVPATEIRPTAVELGQALAVTGWTVVAYAPAELGDALLSGPAAPGQPDVVLTPDGREIERGVIGFNVGDLFGGKDEQEPEAVPKLELRRRPLAALQPLAAATGGSVVRDSAVLDDRLVELARRTLLAVELPVAAAPSALEVRDGAGQRVLAPSWLARGAPAALSTARARLIAASGESLQGELQVAALVAGSDPPRLAVELSSSGGSRALQPPLRLTVAEVAGDSAVVLQQREIGPEELARGRLELTLAVGRGEERPLVVVVDELASDRWGGTFAGYSARADAFDAGDGTVLLDLPDASAIRLLAPQAPLLVGRVRFAAVVADTAIERVEFLLDGSQAAVRQAPPFEAELDLGPLPRTRRVEVVARNGQGEELGRDVLLVNSGNSQLSVRLTAPGAEVVAGGGVRAQDNFFVEAEVAAPRGARVSSVEFFWLDRLLGTAYTPPYRQQVVLPEGDARGFVRAVVSLADGSVVEEVLFVNSAGSGERLQVTLVEVLAVVTDATGKPVSDLGREAFEVKEEGDVRELAVFSNAEQLPLTVGLAVDSSASMFIKLPKVQLVAMDFLRDLLSERDRGFVIGFGREPVLLTPTTGDVARLISGVGAMRPEGFTSIWKGIVYSLVQLQGAPGKKALIVYSDGADEDPEFSYRSARRFARIVGVPIYVILSNNEIVRTQGHGLNVRGFLGRLKDLVGDVGGKVYYTRVGQDLAGVYAEIAEELRSQYVLGYYGEQDDDGGWRKITVNVNVPGLRVRAARGRYP